LPCRKYDPRNDPRRPRNGALNAAETPTPSVFFDPDMLFYNHGVRPNDLKCGSLFKIKDAKKKTLLNRGGELAGPE
jgi:hypothetical protein